MKDLRTLNAAIWELDRLWQDLFSAMSGDQRLRMIEMMKDLRAIADKMESFE